MLSNIRPFNPLVLTALTAVCFLLAVGTVSLGAVQPTAIQLKADLGKPVLLAGEAQKAYLRIGLRGIAIEKESDRPPLNLAIVLDKSGSMNGDKIAEAREAALLALDRLGRDDIVSIVTYDSTVQVVVPATKLTDREDVYDRIRRIHAGGNTALFAGVSKGGDELHKFYSPDRVNRLILLSDGLANVGPSSPADLGRLGTSLAKEGITVSTVGLGLGYNEDLMVRLAEASDGNHFFAENANDLAGTFDFELGRALSVVAQRIRIDVQCAPGVRPIRSIGRQVEIVGNQAILDLNQIYADHEKYLVLELEVPASEAGENRELASVKVEFSDAQAGEKRQLASVVAAQFAPSEKDVESNTNKDIMADVVEQIATENSVKAVELRDKGQVEEAKQVLIDNEVYLRSNAAQLDSKKLDNYAEQQERDAATIEKEEHWKGQRKKMQESNWLIFGNR